VGDYRARKFRENEVNVKLSLRHLPADFSLWPLFMNYRSYVCLILLEILVLPLGGMLTSRIKLKYSELN